MSKKQSLMWFTLFDLMAIGGLFIFFYEVNRIWSDASSQVDMIKFGNRFSFLIVGITLPIIHFIGLVEYYWPLFINKNKRILNYGLILVGVLLLFAGFSTSHWIKFKSQREIFNQS